MAALEIDIGNSRTKYRFDGVCGSVASPALPLEPSIAPDRICVSAVKGDQQQIGSALQACYGVVPEFARVTTTCAGVTCCYENPGRLGVDRWLAVLAAWQLTRDAVLVCDAGTALTLDYVDAKGNHRGGWIAPGLATMRRALATETRDVRPDDRVAAALEWGVNTDAAVAGGTLAMAVGAVTQAVQLAAKGGVRPRVLITGGDAPALIEVPALAEVVGTPVEHVPTLVLDGLRLALP